MKVVLNVDREADTTDTTRYGQLNNNLKQLIRYLSVIAWLSTYLAINVMVVDPSHSAVRNDHPKQSIVDGAT
jgi:hypothetical protein